MPSPLVRAARSSALATPWLWVMSAPSSAVAMTPEGWEAADPISTLTALLIFAGIPLALFLTIVALTVAPSVARGSSPSVDRWASPTWFNGPTGDRALAASPAMGGADAKALTQSSTRALPGDGTGSGGSTALGHRAGSSGFTAGSSTAGGSPAGGHTASGLAPNSPAAEEHTSRGLIGGSSTGRETATPGPGVPAEHDVLAAASSPGGGASARW